MFKVCLWTAGWAAILFRDVFGPLLRVAGIAPLSRPSGEDGPGNMTRRRLGAMLLAVAVTAAVPDKSGASAVRRALLH